MKIMLFTVVLATFSVRGAPGSDPESKKECFFGGPFARVRHKRRAFFIAFLQHFGAPKYR